MKKIQIDYDIFIKLSSFFVAYASEDDNYDYTCDYIQNKLKAISEREKYKEKFINKY